MEKWSSNLIKAQSLLIVGKISPDELMRFYDVTSTDYTVLEEVPIKIEQIRNLIHWINLKPMGNLVKIALIHNAENMTAESANAVLKTLEEPPPYGRIVLTTLNEGKILATIKSRCQKIRIPLRFDSDIPENFVALDDLLGKSIKEQFDWVKKISDLENTEVALVLTLWENDLHEKLLDGGEVTAKIKAISKAKGLLETNISVKLLLENLLVGLG